jgi:hypothetical protein
LPINVVERERESEILIGMIKFEKEGLDDVSQLIRTLERKGKREDFVGF